MTTGAHSGNFQHSRNNGEGVRLVNRLLETLAWEPGMIRQRRPIGAGKLAKEAGIPASAVPGSAPGLADHDLFRRIESPAGSAGEVKLRIGSAGEDPLALVGPLVLPAPVERGERWR